MSFITLANTNKIIFNSDIHSLCLKGAIYKIPIYFFSKYEENALLAIQELLKDPDKYFTEIYKPYKPIDTYTYVYEGQKPGYHKFSCCPRLHSHYENFEIPREIQDKGSPAVQEFRQWFETVKHLLEKPDIFVERLRYKYGITTNPQAIKRGNSGSIKLENMTIEKLENKIDFLIKEAGRFYSKYDKHKIILRRFSKYTHLAYKSDFLHNNDTGYSDQDVKELLRAYDEKFKRPLKQRLIEYYRLKLNPEIKMEGQFLAQLGFKPCGNCHNPQYQPKQKNEPIFSWDFIANNRDFFLEIFSTHYPFSEKQLLKYQNILSFGIEYAEMDEASQFFCTGLIFNRNIAWTENVQRKYYQPELLLYVGNSIDVYSLETKFDRFPLNFSNVIDAYEEHRITLLCLTCNSGEDLAYWHEELEKECNDLRRLSNPGYIFSLEEIFSLTEEKNLILASFQHFYEQVLSKISTSVDSFTIESFLDYIITVQEKT